jgi:hypothetical protein
MPHFVNFDKKESNMVDWSKMDHTVVFMDPEWLIPAINVRSEEELQIEALIPSIIETQGQVTETLMAWRPKPDNPFYKLLKNPKRDAIPVRGHRRRGATLAIRRNPDKYPKTVWENAGRLPVKILDGWDERDARKLTLDSKDALDLCKYDAVREVIRQLLDGQPYQEIMEDIPEFLYKAFHKDQHLGYKAMMRIDEASKRKKQREQDLRNVVDRFINTCVLLDGGLTSGVMCQQVVWAYKALERQLDKDKGERLMMHFKHTMWANLRSAYSKTQDNCPPITKIDILGDKDYVVEGGSPEVQKELKVILDEFRMGTQSEGRKAVPTVKDRSGAAEQVRDPATAGFLLWAAGDDNPENKELIANRHVEADLAHWRIQREKTRNSINGQLPKVLQDLVKAESGEKDMDKLKDAWLAAGKAIKSK